MKVDACSVTQNGKRAISFMSQAVGLMADLDIGTEHLRWLGDARFVVGLFRGRESFFFNGFPSELPLTTFFLFCLTTQ